MTLAGHSFNNVSLNDQDEEAKGRVRGEDGEFSDTRDRDEETVLTTQKQRLRNQDEHIDAISGIVQNIKYETQNFDQEVTYQNKMLDRIDKDIDRNQEKLIKVD